MKGQAFIYPSRPDTIDPRSLAIIPGRPDNSKPYRHGAIGAVVGAFFKGKNPPADRIATMFVPNEAGNYEATAPMVSTACATIYSTLGDWQTGEHKPSDFDGSRVQDVYETHMELLARFKAKQPEVYRTTMETIFAKAS
ncbi:hypothetical protein GGX14DRAFT_560071 [Mycena pura]|uniref:DUF6532 domain-containing protein n=1 Tax=Mycena pura TaxID=153505 RepID=A0AAD6VTY9_9AGAR|nr:hypothetical protein GGX14DRAFT_560071 [Mycena pura]